MTSGLHMAARFSLSFLWLFTGITSAFFGRDIGYEVLSSGGITGRLADISILLGSILDVSIGVWLLTKWQDKLCCLVQMTVIIVYTLLLTIIDSSFWVHPFGPLTKNIPLLALIYIFYKEAERPPE